MCTISQCAFDTRLSFETVEKVFKQFRDAAASKHGRARRREASVRTRKLLDWSQKHLPHYFKSPPSRMHTWLAANLEKLSRSRLPSETSDSSRSCLPSRTSDSPQRATVHRSRPADGIYWEHKSRPAGGIY